jgi:DNA segregation ATPase FtsK/SpoIIIE-like protein
MKSLSAILVAPLASAFQFQRNAANLTTDYAPVTFGGDSVTAPKDCEGIKCEPLDCGDVANWRWQSAEDSSSCCPICAYIGEKSLKKVDELSEEQKAARAAQEEAEAKAKAAAEAAAAEKKAAMEKKLAEEAAAAKKAEAEAAAKKAAAEKAAAEKAAAAKLAAEKAAAEAAAKQKAAEEAAKAAREEAAKKAAEAAAKKAAEEKAAAEAEAKAKAEAEAVAKAKAEAEAAAQAKAEAAAKKAAEEAAKKAAEEAAAKKKAEEEKAAAEAAKKAQEEALANAKNAEFLKHNKIPTIWCDDTAGSLTLYRGRQVYQEQLRKGTAEESTFGKCMESCVAAGDGCTIITYVIYGSAEEPNAQQAMCFYWTLKPGQKMATTESQNYRPFPPRGKYTNVISGFPSANRPEGFVEDCKK